MKNFFQNLTSNFILTSRSIVLFLNMENYLFLLSSLLKSKAFFIHEKGKRILVINDNNILFSFIIYFDSFIFKKFKYSTNQCRVFFYNLEIFKLIPLNNRSNYIASLPKFKKLDLCYKSTIDTWTNI